MKISDKFECPSCGHKEIEEVQGGATVVSEVLEVENGGDTTYGPTELSDGYTDRFQCVNCGLVLPGISDTEELFEYLNS